MPKFAEAPHEAILNTRDKPATRSQKKKKCIFNGKTVRMTLHSKQQHWNPKDNEETSSKFWLIRIFEIGCKWNQTNYK